MLRRWRIKAAPTSKDPQRRLLQVKGALEDVHSLIRRFGAMCGRPKKEHGDLIFNYRLYLHAVTDGDVSELEKELESLGGKRVEEAPAAGPKGEEAPPPSAPKAEIGAPGAAAGGAKVVEKQTSADDLPAFPEITLSAPGTSAAPAPASAPASAPVPVADPATAPLCGIAVEVNKGSSLDAISVGKHNRRAHAAAMAVLSSPGTMHNPLYICGPAGTGKSHMLHGIAMKLNDQNAGAPVLLTNGARYARAIEAAVKNARLQEIAEFSSKSGALIIDDVHLMGVTEENRSALADIIGMYRSEEKQIIVASIYPQKLLSGLDEALQFQFHVGHSVDLKLPDDAAGIEIVLQVLERIGFPTKAEESKVFLAKLVGDFENLEGYAARLKTLQSLRQGQTLADAEPLLFRSPVEVAPATEAELKGLLASAKKPTEGTLNALCFYPEGNEVYAQWAWSRIFEVCVKNQWAFPFKAPVYKSYQVDPPGAAPFAVALECLAARPAAALIVGPLPNTELSQHEADFKYVAGHLLKDVHVGLGWLSHVFVKDESIYPGICLDMIATTARGAS